MAGQAGGGPADAGVGYGERQSRDARICRGRGRDGGNGGSRKTALRFIAGPDHPVTAGPAASAEGTIAAAQRRKGGPAGCASERAAIELERPVLSTKLHTA